MDSAIHRINLYLLESAIGSPINIYPLDSDLSDGSRYPAFKQLGTVGFFFMSSAGTELESSFVILAARGEPTLLRVCVQSYVVNINSKTF